ncbi:MAG: hypothetical protein KA285_07345, partial [Bacteroidia bacterium]|nr:hypothetical protein [Bacteroidia bacterium]
MLKQFKITLLLIIIWSLNSCIKDDDLYLKNLEFTGWTPDIGVPILSTNVDIHDLLDISGTADFNIDNSGNIFILSNSSVFYQNGASCFRVPDQVDSGQTLLTASDIQSLTVTGSYSAIINHNFPFSLGSGQRLDSMILKSGNLKVSIYNGLSRQGTLNIIIPAATKNGVPFNKTFPFSESNGGTPSYTFSLNDLDGYKLNFTSTSNPSSLQILYGVTYTNTGSGIPVPGTGLNFYARFDSLEYSFAAGYFGDYQFPIPIDSAQIDLLNDNPNDTFSLTNPTLKVEFQNSIGMPIRLSNILIQPITNSGQLITLTINPSFPNPKIISGASYVGQVISDSLLVNNQNSNIATAYSQHPGYIIYSADAGTNTGNPSIENFITDSSYFSANLITKTPIEGWSKRFTVTDTSDFDLNDAENIDTAIFRVDAFNGFPLNAYTQIYFMDSNYIALDSLLLHPEDLIIESATVNSSGVAVTP